MHDLKPRGVVPSKVGIASDILFFFHLEALDGKNNRNFYHAREMSLQQTEQKMKKDDGKQSLLTISMTIRVFAGRCCELRSRVAFIFSLRK